MTGLTVKQRTKVNAALCFIHDQGLDARAVSELAHTIMATGQDARSAYERALNQFAESNPEAGLSLGKITRLVEASCPRTVAQYDQALSSYIDTGDDTALAALAPMIKTDSIALAIQNGELTAEQAHEDGLEIALGIKPSAELNQATNTPERIDGSALAASTNSQVSLNDRAPAAIMNKAQRRASEAPYVGPESLGQGAAPGSDFATYKEAARMASNRVGRATLEVNPTA